MSEFGPLQIGSYHLADGEWDAYEKQNPKAARYSLAYAVLRQQGNSHEEAVQGAQLEAYGRVISTNPQPENLNNWKWAGVPLSTPLASLLEDRPPTPQEAEEILNQLKLGLESRIGGRFVSPTKVSNPETVTASMAPREADLPRSGAWSLDQMDMMDLIAAAAPSKLSQPEQPVPTPAIPDVEASPRSRRRMAGGLAVTAGLGLGGLLTLAALTDPYRVKQQPPAPTPASA